MPGLNFEYPNYKTITFFLGFLGIIETDGDTFWVIIVALLILIVITLLVLWELCCLNEQIMWISLTKGIRGRPRLKKFPLLRKNKNRRTTKKFVLPSESDDGEEDGREELLAETPVENIMELIEQDSENDSDDDGVDRARL